MTTDLEDRLARALAAAVEGVPDEPPAEWRAVVGSLSPCGHPARSVPGRRVRLGVVAASVVVLAIIAVSVVALVPAQQRATGASARLLTAPPRTGSLPMGAPGKWDLVSSVTDAHWLVNREGPVTHAGAITCTVSATCYVASGISDLNPAVPPVPGTVLNVSEDNGANWATYELPSGLGLTSALSCPAGDGQDCLAGGTSDGSPALLRTADGGAHWSDRPLPAADGTPTALSCVSVTQCVGLFVTPVNPLSFGQTVNEDNTIYLGGTLSGSILATNDGGLTWRRSDLPREDVPQSVSCTPGRCVVIAATPTQTVSGHITRGAVFSSSDGGRTWRPGTLPSGFGVVWSGPSQVDCVNASTCWATGTVESSDSASPSDTDLVSVVASSRDGGSTWQVRPTPSGISRPRLYSVSCPTAQECWLAGWNGPDSVTLPSRSVVLATVDGGKTWSQDTLDIGSGTLVGAISCPTVHGCVGLGGVDSESGRVSVYSNAANAASSE